MNMLDEMEKTSLHQDLMTRLHVQDIRRVLEKFWELWQVVTSKDFDLKECYRNVIEQYYNDAGEPIAPEFDFDKRYEVVLEEFLRHKGVKERHIND